MASRTAYQSLIDLLNRLPGLDSPAGRQAFCARAFFGSDLLQAINYEGDQRTFISHLIRKASLYPQSIEGVPALHRLLDTARAELGADGTAAADALIPQLGAITDALRAEQQRRTAIFIGVGVVAVLLALVALFGVVRGAVTSAIVPTATPTPLPAFAAGCGLRVLVTYFDAPTSIRDDARAFVDQLWEQLDRELRSRDSQLSMRVCTLSPAQTGASAGTDAEAKAALSNWNANIVLYGSVDETENGYVIEPDYYADPTIFAEAAEMAESLRLGSDVSTGIPLQDNFGTALTLESRASGIALVFAGLSYYLTEDYNRALETFQQIDRDWRTARGADVVDILVGNTYLRLASVAAQRGELDAADANLGQAFEAYQAAQAVNAQVGENYERVLVALASAQYLEWSLARQRSCALSEGECPTGDCQSDRALLDAARETLQSTLTATEAVADTVVEAQRDFVWLQVGYQLWRNHDDETALRDMEAAYQRLLNRYEAQPENYWFQLLAAEAQWYMGRRDYAEGDYEDALEEYTAALETLDNGLTGEATDLRRLYYRWSIAESLEADGQFDAALEAYDAANQQARLVRETFGRDMRCEIALFELKAEELQPSG
jgi:tetratricopeptide (TPR) repeat protein